MRLKNAAKKLNREHAYNTFSNIIAWIKKNKYDASMHDESRLVL
jgi:hypothetical protein